jgi:hypothetical protein
MEMSNGISAIDQAREALEAAKNGLRDQNIGFAYGKICAALAALRPIAEKSTPFGLPSVSPSGQDVRATDSADAGLQADVFLGRAPMVGEKWWVKIGELANVETKYLRDVTARTVELAQEMTSDGMRFRTEDVEFVELAEQPPAPATKEQQP